ncbi:MAG: malonic semialdehyde reductase [Sphingomonadales bacterium]
MLSDKDFDLLFRSARSHSKWLDKPVSVVTLQALYDLVRWGPTSANCFPARFVFASSAEAKERLAQCVMAGNVEKVKTAPVVAIIGYDTRFFDRLPKLFPHNPQAREWFANDAALAESTAFRNSSLQGGYLVLAARALGLDCGPMSGFDNAAVDREFFPEGKIKSNFICALGHGDPAALFPRSPRPDFDEVCSFV